MRPTAILCSITHLLVFASACNSDRHGVGSEQDLFHIDGMKDFELQTRLIIGLDTTQCQWYVSSEQTDVGFTALLNPCDYYNDVAGIWIEYEDPTHPNHNIAMFSMSLDSAKQEYLQQMICSIKFGEPDNSILEYMPYQKPHVRHLEVGSIDFEYTTDCACVLHNGNWSSVHSDAWALVNGQILTISYSDSIEHIAIHNENFRRILSTVRVLE